jgi:hypothetical protein
MRSERTAAAGRRTRRSLALLVLSQISSVLGWTEDGYPDCSLKHGPACFPNRRAPHHNSLLNSLFNKWCSDKGTYWLSKHNYGAAYDTVLRPTRRRTRNLLELGVGDETAGSLNAWREYFPRAEFWIVDVDVVRFHDKKQWAWASRQKRRHGCFDDKDVWTAPRVHPLFGVDSSNRTQLRSLPLPAGASMDVIIDDASHALAHQLAALEALWPKLRDGGFYIVEDLTIGALPWMRGDAGTDQVRRAPSNNSNCGHECHYVQRPSEHPFLKRLIPSMADQRAARDALSLGASLPNAVERILDNNMWFYTSTGAHVGGGLDSTVIIQKTEAGLEAGGLDETLEEVAAAKSQQPPTTLSTSATSTTGTATQAADTVATNTNAVAAATPAAHATPAYGYAASSAAAPAWAVSTTVHAAIPPLDTLAPLLALFVAVGAVAIYRSRLVGVWRRLIGRGANMAE